MAKKQLVRVEKCECGYNFCHSASISRQDFESFAIIRDKDYRRFMKLEAKVLEASDDVAKIRAIAKSSKYVGSLVECPSCGRLLLRKPGQAVKEYYPSGK